MQPSSSSEQDRQERAQRMIREAIETHAPFEGVAIDVYAKGSYANNTNVRLDSDVDIVVECRECMFYDYAENVSRHAAHGVRRKVDARNLAPRGHQRHREPLRCFQC